MIITRTPFRISFSGGGTDLKGFFQQEFGCVVNAAINKYVYVAIHPYYDKSVTVIKYSKTEIVEDWNEIKHPLFKEALKLTEVKGVEIATIADVPSAGTGLGSSSSFLVGLLNALYSYKGILKSSQELAEIACRIERDILQEEGGYQDQYIAAYGGLKFMQFNEDFSVYVDPIIMPKGLIDKINNKLLLFYTGFTRKSFEIHKEQRKNMHAKMEFLMRMKKITIDLRNELQNGNIESLGSTLHEGWAMKKQLASGISNDTIDDFYEKAIQSGASGGKITGAGGGGFLLLFCREEKQGNVRKALHELQEFDVKIEPEGSKIIYVIN